MLPLAAFIALFLIVWGALVAAKPFVAGLVDRMGRVVTKVWVRGFLVVIALLGVGAATAAVVGDAFFDLAELVVAKNTSLQVLDQRWHDLAISGRTPGDTTFFAAVSTMGGPVGMGVTAVVVTAALLLRRRRRWALYLLVTAGGGILLNLELKRHFARARPDLSEMLRLAHGYSFPSGHAMGATVVAGALTYLSSRVLKTWQAKAAAIAFSTAFVAAVSASRVYLGAHWLSDVAAGVSGGGLWFATTTIAYETLRRIILIRRLRFQAAHTH